MQHLQIDQAEQVKSGVMVVQKNSEVPKMGKQSHQKQRRER
jgi:hypothetical protein